MGRLKQASLGNTSGLSAAPKTEAPKPKSPDEKLVPINIKITRHSQRWLSDRAQQVRDNNDHPVAAKDRVFPQHLIMVAIDLLEATDIDWSQVADVQSLKEQLNP